jgi:hypothetical protein
VTTRRELRLVPADDIREIPGLGKPALGYEVVAGAMLRFCMATTLIVVTRWADAVAAMAATAIAASATARKILRIYVPLSPLQG